VSTPAGHCPHTVRREVMHMWWDDLTFLHWPYPPEQIAALLPDGLEPHVIDGVTWVGLIPFDMTVGLPGGAVIPWQGRFAETNVRTYVIGPNGEPGVWFCSLEASKLIPTATARATYGLPYFWADMSIDRFTDADGTERRTYTARRRWPGPVGASTTISVTLGDDIPPSEVTELEHHLTARWRLFSVWRGRLVEARIEHPPWPLRRATLDHLDDELVAAAGLTPSDDAPLVHYTPGTSIRIGRPELL